MLHSEETIFIELQKIIHKLFDVESEQIFLESKLYEDLDLDSIDAVDLIVHLQAFTNKKFQPAEFKAVKTVGDVVSVIYTKLSTQ